MHDGDYPAGRSRSRSRDRHRPSRGPERVQWEGHPAWQGMLAWYFKRLLTVTVIVAVLYAVSRAGMLGGYWVALAAVLLYAGTFWVAHLIRRTTTYKVTNRAIYERFGIVSTTQDYVRLEEITSIRIDQTLTERLFGIGSINFDTAGEQAGGEDKHIWTAVRNPTRVRALIERLRDGSDPFGFDEDPDLYRDESF